MHIVIAILSGIAGMIWALNALSRTGFSFDSLNPFAWYRRHKWLKQMGQSPAYLLTRPMEVAGLLAIATAKLDGELTREMKTNITKIFESEFGIEEKLAYDLFVSSSFILQKEPNLIGKLKNVLKNSKENFIPSQFDSTLDIMQKISVLEGQASEAQIRFIEEFKKQFKTEQIANDKWS